MCIANRPLYLEPHQARSAAPTPFEDLLGDAIERAYAQGIHELESLVAYLNQSGPSAPNGSQWTTELFCAEMARLGA
ncbi:MAG TPA: recombinase-like helix-turn-helix domain-containing protein [Aromatoleum sp.]|uniref:recombinase-like helix-turn-helix domain-containing protein n=1 Tax=Aromatoleum sp. TaxID=2307007 RepID=UPI002B47046F|nr:recombinase-like helix-turn-helix domain-containing protein [Aromatoleum sp.]HJV27747.1 recombinase-like helix-turn-helix domain-containing protein [Aromatoleum sp.]